MRYSSCDKSDQSCKEKVKVLEKRRLWLKEWMGVGPNQVV